MLSNPYGILDAKTNNGEKKEESYSSVTFGDTLELGPVT